MGNLVSDNKEAFMFSKQEMKILYKNFMELDSNKSGLIEPHEFFDVEELKSNPIVQRVISVFDLNQDGKISFYEFILGLGTLADQSNEEEKLRFAFEIYDANKDGFISNGDLFSTLKLFVGNNLKDIHIQQLVDRTIIAADIDGDGKISYEEFVSFVQNVKVYELFSMNFFN